MPETALTSFTIYYVAHALHTLRLRHRYSRHKIGHAQNI